jgi:hypothetical protein
MNLQYVFAGISLWSFHQDKKDFINGITFLRVDDFSVMEMVGYELEWLTLWPKQPSGNGLG